MVFAAKICPLVVGKAILQNQIFIIWMFLQGLNRYTCMNDVYKQTEVTTISETKDLLIVNIKGTWIKLDSSKTGNLGT